MRFEIDFYELALKEWKKLAPDIKAQFRKKLKKLQDNPYVESARLHDDLKGCFKIKLRASGYRLVYKVIDNELVILVIAVGKREKSDVYNNAKQRV